MRSLLWFRLLEASSFLVGINLSPTGNLGVSLGDGYPYIPDQGLSKEWLECGQDTRQEHQFFDRSRDIIVGAWPGLEESVKQPCSALHNLNKATGVRLLSFLPLPTHYAVDLDS
ncbi:hypothetical protein CC2G_004663 [Coprinopsis cinerea AmutBmut pab1-1]|nr:hypothetical protein CC2G_004663 [Coprinopsis cinerea AmutBmut pab1-1]